MTDEQIFKAIVNHMMAAAHDYIRALEFFGGVELKDIGKLEEDELKKALTYCFNTHAIDCMKELKGEKQ